MKEDQEVIINEEISTYYPCEINTQHIDKMKLKDLSILRLSTILKQKIISGTDMKAVFCLFETLFLATSQKKRDGICVLTENIREYISNFKHFSTESAQGYIYMVDFFSPDINLVIKVSKYKPADMLREYFIGIKAINKLRYLIPTFSYTLGAFKCAPTFNDAGSQLPNYSENLCDSKSNITITPFVLYEKIIGTSVSDLLKDFGLTFTFDQWLVILFQLLLGLEVAQRELRFTHYDLHSENVMIRKNDSYSYNVPLDMATYNIVNPEFIPVVIDFGMSCSYIDGKYFGAFDYSKYGMEHFIVPGHDMYKFISHSLVTARKDLKTKIRSVFRFYGEDDPYNIISDPYSGAFNATNEYCAKVISSPAANYTPIMLIDWLWKQKEYRSILEPYITKTERIEYLPIQYSSTIKQYDDIFNYTKEGTDKAVEIADKCFPLKSSYVMSKYNIMVLEKYNKELKSPKLDSKILLWNMFLSQSEYELISSDINMLEKVFAIRIPTQDDLDKITNLLTIKINYEKVTVDKAVKEIDNIFVYHTQITPYLQFYFTMLELGLTDKFNKWVQKFKQSDIYLFHNNNIIQIERAIRWSYSIRASVI
jgi:hypothetical protein